MTLETSIYPISFASTWGLPDFWSPEASMFVPAAASWLFTTSTTKCFEGCWFAAWSKEAMLGQVAWFPVSRLLCQVLSRFTIWNIWGSFHSKELQRLWISGVHIKSTAEINFTCQDLHQPKFSTTLLTDPRAFSSSCAATGSHVTHTIQDHHWWAFGILVLFTMSTCWWYKMCKTSIWVFPEMGVPQNGWFIKKNPFHMDDLGVPTFMESPLCCGNTHPLFFEGFFSRWIAPI